MATIKILHDKVVGLLRQYPSMRDDDMKLIAEIWREEDKYMFEISFFEALAGGLVSHPESIMRSRRKAQEMFPELRGKKWVARHEHQKKIKNMLKVVVEESMGQVKMF